MMTTPPFAQHPSRQDGFTLVELLAALLLVSILLGAAAPSLGELRAGSAVRAESDRFTEALQRARLLAVTTGHDVTLCPSPDGIDCGRGGDWSPGWISFLDQDGNGERSDDEPVQDRGTPQAAGVRIAGPASRERIRLDADGTAYGSNATLRVCHERRQAQGRKIILAPTGRVRTADPEPAVCGARTAD